MEKKNILLTGSEGSIGSFLKKKLKHKFNIIRYDIKLKKKLNDELIFDKIFLKKIYAIIFCHGKNTTPLGDKTSINRKFFFDEKQIEEFLETNLYLNIKIINKYINTNSFGRVINFSSIYSLKSPKHFIYKNFSKEIGYSISKAAANMMMKYLGAKFAKKFLFNSIILGGVYSKDLSNFFLKNYNKNNPTGRMMKLKEVLPIVNFLLDENNTYTNAQEIVVDGGWLSW
jgi:NAD(P)-dependent dehydrogenase (short-subunit alcohol dehydrogenase family)